MRRGFFALAVAACGLIFSASPAPADTFTVYPVDSDGSTTEKHLFSPGETPFIYAHLPNAGLNSVVAFWKDPDTNLFFTSSGLGTDVDHWFSLDNGVDADNNPVTWNAVSKPGTWDVGVSHFYAQDFSGDIKATSFTVTPEPATAALFLAGGLTLAAASRKKKRTSNSL